jgi:photosystem II stability/assembly factor-like uncharacterized protein
MQNGMFLPTVLLRAGALACLLFAAPLLAQGSADAGGVLTGSNALQWRNIGPFRGGRVIAVSGVVKQPNLFYMGASSGGVWKTTNYGKSWENLSDGQFANANIGAIAVAPSDPQVIYVGTGESAIRNSALMGDGMYKSIDAGKTWKRIGLDETQIISRIVVDQKDPNLVYVAALGHEFGSNAERGVFKSSDGGNTWKKILFVDNNTGAIDLVVNPRNPQILYAATWQVYRRAWTLESGGPGSGIWKSSDGGGHWVRIGHGTGLPAGIYGRIGLGIAPSDPDVMYAMVHAKDGGVFRSDDAGASWHRVNDEQSLTQRAFYYSTLFVSPKDADTVYFPQVDGLFVSHDGGRKIALVNGHHDDHALWINPDNPEVMVEGYDFGVSVTQDGGQSWSSVNNQQTGQFYHVNLDDQFPFHVYGAQQDGGSYAGPSATRGAGIPREAWIEVPGSESNRVVPEPGKPWITYGTGYSSFNSAYWKGNARTGVWESISSWPLYKTGAAPSELKQRIGWFHSPALFAPSNPHEFLMAAQYLLKTTDGGFSWTSISPDLTRNDKTKQGRSGGPISSDVTGAETYDTISALSISPLDAGLIWTGSDDGLVHVTTDGGAHWSTVTPQGLPMWSVISSIEASHTDKGVAFLTASRYQWDDFKPYVYKTTDYGKHWSALTSGLPGNESVEAIRQDPDDADLLFLGNGSSVHMSTDGGAQWRSLALNLPTVKVSDIAIQTAQHALVISTFGRGFWVLDDLQLLEQVGHAQTAGTGPWLYAPQQTWLVTRYGDPDPAESANRAVGATVFFSLPADYDGHTPVTLSFSDAQGHPINSFTLPTAEDPEGTTAHLHAGLNRFQWNLRYPNAVEVKGYYTVALAGIENGVLVGPEVVPGRYHAVLQYGSTTQEQPFEVRLDPRLDTTQQQLQDRFDLLMQIHDTLTRMDTRLNQAIDLRRRLQQALADKKLSAGKARDALAALDKDIGDLVQLKVTAIEGNVVYELKLRSSLGFLANDIGLAYRPITPAQREVYGVLAKQAQDGDTHLQADIKRAGGVLGT